MVQDAIEGAGGGLFGGPFVDEAKRFFPGQLHGTKNRN